MAPTKSVPAAFHSELSEYAHLLRAIRTNSTLDIVPHLVKANPDIRRSGCDSDQGDSLESEEDTHLNGPEASRAASELTEDRNPSKGKVQDKLLSKTSKRPRGKRKGGEGGDRWTRWPLLREHCPLPEWTFDEEVMAIAEQCLRFRTSVPQDLKGSDDVETSRVDDHDMTDFTLSPTYLSGLTSEVASKLTSILSLLASHRPSSTFAKHCRLAPMSWLDVLEVVGVAGIFDLAMVEDVKERMEAIFGQSQSQIISCMQVLEASRCPLAVTEGSYGRDLPIIQPPFSRRLKKRKHGYAADMPADAQEHVANDGHTSS